MVHAFIDEAAIITSNMAKDIMKKFTSPGLRNSHGGVGFLTLGLMVLVGLMVNVGKAQTSFSSAQVLTGNSGATVPFDNSGFTPGAGAPSPPGFPANAPLWYQWTAPVDGEVTLDTIGSVDTLLLPVDTVLGVY